MIVTIYKGSIQKALLPRDYVREFLTCKLAGRKQKLVCYVYTSKIMPPT